MRRRESPRVPRMTLPRFLAATAVLLAVCPLLADDLVVSEGTTVLTKSGTIQNAGWLRGTLNGAPTYSGGTTVAPGAMLQLGDDRSNLLYVGEVLLSGTDGNTFRLLGPGAVVNDGTLVLNHRPIRFEAYSSIPDEPGFAGPGSNIDFRLLVDATISGTGSVIQRGSSAQTILSGANTYSGGTDVQSGLLLLTGQGRVGTGSLAVAGGATFDLGGTTASTVAGLSGEGLIKGGGQLAVASASANTFNGQLWNVAVRHSGTGSLTLGGNSDNISVSALVAGGTLILAKDSNSGVHAIGSQLTVESGGTARLGGTGGDQLYDHARVDVQSGGTFDLAGRNETLGALQGGGTVTNSGASAATLGVAGGEDGVFSGTLQDGAGGLALAKSGGGKLTLSGTNNYTGATTLAGGTLALGSAGALSAGTTLTFSGGTLQWTSGNAADVSARFSTAVGQLYRFDAGGQSVTLAADLASAGASLRQSGSGVLSLTGANAFTGGIALAGGALELGSAGALGSSGTIAFEGGELRWSAANATDYSARFSTAANQHYRLNPGGQNVVVGTALTSVGGALTKSGTGTLTLGTPATLSGGVAVDAGTLALGGALQTNTLTLGTGSMLRGNGHAVTASALSGAGSFYTGGATLTVSGSANSTFSGDLRDAALVKSGSGTLTLAGTIDNVSSAATVLGGTLVLAKDSSASVHALGTGGTHRIASGATLRLGGTGGDQIYNGSTLNLEAGGTFDLNTRAETIGSGATLAGNVQIAIAGPERGSTYGALAVSGSATLSGSLSLALATGFALDTTYDLFDFTSVSGNWSNVTLSGLASGSLTYASSTWTLVSGDTTYAFDPATGQFYGTNDFFDGNLTITGVRELRSPGSLGTTGTIVLAGGTLQWSAKNQTDYSARFSPAAGQAYNFDTNGQTVTLASALTSAGGALRKTGEGTLRLTAANTYDGGTTISGGTLEITRPDALGSGALANHGTLRLAASSDFAFAKAIAGTGGITLAGNGTFTLTGANTYTGTTRLEGGVLSLTTANALGATSRIVFAGGTLQWTAANTTDYSGAFRRTLGEAAENIRLDTNGQNVTLAQSFNTATGSLTKLGAGTLTLAGSVGVGDLHLEAGTLRYAANGGGFDTVRVASGATLAVDQFLNTDALTGSGTISGVSNTGSILLMQRGTGNFTGRLSTLLLGLNSGSQTLSGSVDNDALRISVLGGELLLAKQSSATVHATTELALANGTARLMGTGGDQIRDDGTLLVNGGTFDLNGRSETVGVFVGNGGTVLNQAAGTTAVLTFGSSGESQGYLGHLTDGAGQLALVKQGTDRFMILETADYTGTTTVRGGSLVVGLDARFTGTSALNLEGTAEFALMNNSIVNVGALNGAAGTRIWGWNAFSGQNPHTLTVSGSADSEFAGVISGLGLTKTGAGTLTLSGTAANEWNHAVVNGGTLVLAKTDATALAALDHSIGSGGTLRLAGGGGDQIADAGRVSVASGGAFDLNGRSETLAAVSGAGRVTNGATRTVSTLTLDSADNVSSAISLENGAGVLALTKTGAGALTLTGALTHTGATRVEAGTLRVNGSATGSAFTVLSGATLGGTGSLGAVDLQAGAMLAPGNSPGLLTIGSGSTLAGTVTMEIGGTQRGVTYDAIDVSGAGQIALRGVLVFDFSGPTTSGATYHLFDFATASGSWSSVGLAGLYSGSFAAAGELWTAQSAGFNFVFNALTGDLTTTASAIPEPSTYALLTGVLVLGLVAWRRRRQLG